MREKRDKMGIVILEAPVHFPSNTETLRYCKNHAAAVNAHSTSHVPRGRLHSSLQLRRSADATGNEFPGVRNLFGKSAPSETWKKSPFSLKLLLAQLYWHNREHRRCVRLPLFQSLQNEVEVSLLKFIFHQSSEQFQRQHWANW
jgi:hypothetical protein